MDDQITSTRIEDCDGAALRRALIGGTLWLEKNAAVVDALNVFPVPDGDTGTNMLLTMRSAMNQVDGLSVDDLDQVAEAAARGALLGARGNSGVILSQIMRGLASSMLGRRSLDGPGLAAALEEAAQTAHRGVYAPVEGTMLTVMREAAERGRSAAQAGATAAEVLRAATEEARESVARTPLLLDVLRAAGVVDAGGQGLYFLLDGMLRFLEGRLEIDRVASAPVALGAAEYAATHVSEDQPIYGYCTEFLLSGDALDVGAVRERIARMGDSTLVVGDPSMIRVHVHSFDPGAVLSYAAGLGTLSRIKIENMQEQHETFVRSRKAASQTGKVSIIAVAAGAGLTEVFLSLGAELVVPGGQTMNPSVEQLLEAVERAANETVILLPNNGNIIPAAQQAVGMASKKLIVVPTRFIPQGVAALLAFNLESAPEESARLMVEAAAAVRTGEITRATRSIHLDGREVREGDSIALLDDRLVATSAENEQALLALLDAAQAANAELVTLYTGHGVGDERAATAARLVRDAYPDLQVEVVAGGQPHYAYIVSIE